MNAELHYGDDEADEYAINRERADRYTAHARAIIAKYSIAESSPFVDQHHATDLTTFHARPLDIALRIRRHKYIDEFPFDITIRSRRVSGEPTEFDKLSAGFCDWYFYGFESDEAESVLQRRVERWAIVDLCAWRKYLIDTPTWRHHTPECRYGVSWFYAFDLRKFPPHAVIACSFDIQQREGNLL